MNKQIFQEYDPIERIDMLKTHSDEIEDRYYHKTLTDEEVTKLKSEFAVKNVELSKLEELKKESMDKFKAQMDPIKSKTKEQLMEIRTGRREVNGELYKVIDHDQRMVGWYDKEGNLIESRPATHEEAQTTLGTGLRMAGNE